MVAAPGPSLTPKVADEVTATGWHVVVCQDAWRLLPNADVLYGCDAKWWHYHKGTDFAGEKWSSHNDKEHADKKFDVAEQYGVNLVAGYSGAGFSIDPNHIHYGDNSGFQALNLAILFGATYIVLVGYDMRVVSGKAHFFGSHPNGLYQREEYGSFARKFTDPPDGVTIINATPGSALTQYPIMELGEAIANYRLHCNGAVTDTSASRDGKAEGTHPVCLQQRDSVCA